VFANCGHNLKVQTAAIGKAFASFALGAFGVLAGGVSKGHLGEFLADLGNSPRRSPTYAPKNAWMSKDQPGLYGTKKPRQAGLSRHSQIRRNLSGCNFGGEGGRRLKLIILCIGAISQN
jgi:hypothetical protein